MRRRAIACALAALLSSGTVVPRAAADDDDGAEPAKPVSPSKAEAERHYKRARELYQLGRYREAIAQLEAALKLDPEGAELLYNLGLVHEKLGDVDEAVQAYRKYLRVLGDDADPEEKKKIEGVIKRLEGAKQELEAREAKKTEHRFTPVTTGLLIGGGASVVLAGVFGVLALGKDRDARNFVVGSGGSPNDRDVLIHSAHVDAAVADVFGVIAIGCVGAALTLYFTTDYPKEDDPSSAPKPAMGLRFSPMARSGGTMTFEVTF
jgi:tetratricopeptide (TPR) repeat protein